MKSGSLVSAIALAAFGASVGCSSAPPPAPAPAQPQPAAQADTTVVNAQGGNCTAITTTVTLCQTNSLCPGLTIDQTAFPGCGFVIHGDKIDPECNCGGDLCSMGSPLTCSDATQLFSSTDVGAVCAQALNRHCLDLGAIGGVESSCQICKDNCNGNPVCLTGCGC